MKVFKYWHREQRNSNNSKGFPYALTAWGGSGNSLEEARTRALEKLDTWVMRLGRGEALGEYEYRNGELREELLETIHDEEGREIAAITRNRYGAAVLNTASLLIADVDADIRKPGFFTRLLALFGHQQRDKAWHLENIRRVAQRHGQLGFIVYETFAGFRVFVTGRDFSPADAESSTLLDELGSDQLYQVLCRTQQCYRARLTAKPWRCGLPLPERNFPRQDSTVEAAFSQWLSNYQAKTTAIAVCRHVEKIGPASPAASNELLALHDRWTLKASGTVLA